MELVWTSVLGSVSGSMDSRGVTGSVCVRSYVVTSLVGKSVIIRCWNSMRLVSSTGLGCLTCAPIYGITGTGSVTSNNIGSSIVVMPCVPSLLGRVGIVRSVTGIVLGRSLTRYMLPITYIISISSMVLLNVAIMHLVIDIINVIVIVLPMSCILRLSFLASML